MTRHGCVPHHRVVERWARAVMDQVPDIADQGRVDPSVHVGAPQGVQWLLLLRIVGEVLDLAERLEDFEDGHGSARFDSPVRGATTTGPGH
jgi:hypothetical protein